MLFWTIIKVAFKSLLANKLRSFLTMLGVIIGVSAVIMMLGLGGGAEKNVTDRVKSLGTNLIIIRPGSQGVGGVRSDTRKNLVHEDALEILKVKGIKMVSPEVNSMSQTKFMNKNTRCSVTGVAPTYFKIRNYEIDKGRIFTDAEVMSMGRIAILGSKTATDLFDEADPIGKIIKIKRMNFKVIGVTKSKGDQGWSNPDDVILIPFTTAMKSLMGVEYLNSISVMFEDGSEPEKVQEDITKVMRRQHKLQEGAPDDFNIRNLSEMFETMKTVTRTFSLLLAGVASVSLLVGGIGIMNIMLVTVTERTREIGIRKALGARDKDVLRQFLIEALVLSLSGGMMGIILGVSSITMFNHYSTFQALISIKAIVISFFFSAAVGIFFGWYPAKKASGLNPIEALRYE